MKFETPLIKAKILKRYKRFLSDIELASGEVICAHVPNTGSMKTCWGENWPVYLSESNNPKRKLKYTLELTDNGNSLISVNTALTNKLVHEALAENIISEVPQNCQIKPEQKIFDSRIDFKLTTESEEEIYIEVKNVTLLGANNIAEFPDSVTVRGQKHLKDLIKIKELGHRAIILYVVNRQDVTAFKPADDIDPEYGKILRMAKEAGVEVLAYQTDLSPQEIKLKNSISIKL